MKKTLSQTHPQLAAELVDQDLATKITYGSAKKVEWRCPLGHTWLAAPNSRTSMGSGCGVCAGKIVVEGVNDLASQRPELAKELVDRSLATTLTANSGRKVEWTCAHGHRWKAAVNTRANGHSCPVCAGKVVTPGFNDIATTHPNIAARLANPRVARTVTAFSSKVVDWLCPKGHTWSAPVARVTSGSGCSVCSGDTVCPGVNDVATTNPEMAAQLVDQSLATTITAQSNKRVEWICDRGHTWKVSPNARRNGSQCPTCTNRTVLAGFNDLATTHPEIAAEAVDDITCVTYGSHRPITWKCSKGHTYTANPLSRTVSKSGCPTCAASVFVSKAERELADVVRALVPDHLVRTTVRDLLKRQELDIVVPALGVAFEFNGLYWHSESYLANSYHRDKSLACQEQGYRLVHVWEDDWRERHEIVIRGIAHRLGATHRLLNVLPGLDPKATERIFARKLTLGTATGSEARLFLEANHLQGAVGCSRYFVLRDDDSEIRALLGVGAKNHGSRVTPAKGVWDVQRYATLGSVPGGFTRLLAHATKSLRASGEQVTTWTSYSDDDVSDGGMYVAAGFAADRRQRPSYSYVGALTGWRRSHRTNWTRGRFETDDTLLYEPGWTEHEAALANGLYRVYDAGKTRWVKNV